MKPVFILLCLLVFAGVSNGQNHEQEIANKIAQRIKDSLQLSDSQKVQIYQINIDLNQQKLGVRTAYSGTDSLRRKIQLVENKRDSLYQVVLGEEKFYLYQQKKRRLVNNN